MIDFDRSFGTVSKVKQVKSYQKLRLVNICFLCYFVLLLQVIFNLFVVFWSSSVNNDALHVWCRPAGPS